ncbi:hypothetical protein F0L74_13560 [Chitinophaga agrisoli]|uniref:Uncharacterized protein n=1 Tax=Chitinophaga agrisoli TaxID=2607653 RepID=A0A5B2VXI9_9BACT|nr:hypothetical protein [Chitinophaga agrisoli]KAA2243514.1 hypothetical protein F0L74_13560 [Chitinophaga agrisoli]
MSAPKKDAPVTPQVDPLQENELGQIEGGFSEIDQEQFTDPGSEINGISCKITNQSQCGA